MNQNTVKVTHVVFRLARFVIDWSKSVELYASALQALTVIPFIGGICGAGSAETVCRGKESKVSSSKIKRQMVIVIFNL